jgi:hypothetical protein
MSGTTSPPLYIVQSKIVGTDWVLTVKSAAAPYYLRLNHNSADESQLWLREDDTVRGGFFLRNPFLDLCLRAGSSQGGNVTMATKTMADPELIWRKEQGENWGCLNKLSDWEQKLNVSGDGPYNDQTPIIQYSYDHGSDHELWKLVQYDPNFGPTNVVYNEGAKTLVLGDPVAAAVSNVDNRSSTAALNTTVTLKTTVQKTATHSVSDQSQDTLTTSMKFGAKFSVEKIFEVSEEGSVTETHMTGRTINDQTSSSESIEVTVSANVLVAPGKGYDVALMARHCTLTIPYTATITRRTVAGAAGVSYQISGVYRYENAYRFDIQVTDPATRTQVPNAVSQSVVSRKSLP